MDVKMGDYVPGSTVSTVCRCCLAEGCYKDISTEYFWMGKREVYSEMLSETLNLSIAFSKSGAPNSNSRLICEACISKLRDATDFKKQVQQCEKMFMQHLDPGSQVEIEVTPASSKDVKVECVKIENEVSDDDDVFEQGAPDAFDRPTLDDDDDYDDADDQPLTSLATAKATMKKERGDILDIMSNKQITVKRKIPETETRASKKTKKDITKPSASKQQTVKAKKSKGANKEKVEKRKIVPLFQVAYDRSLCKPLGTVMDFTKIGFDTKTYFKEHDDNETRPITPCYSPPPVSLGRSTPLVIDEIITSHSLEETQLKTSKRHPDVRQNLLTIFEFSSIYPFVYGNNKFKCFVCAQPYLETAQLRQHMKETHSFGPLKRLVNNRRENVLKVDVAEINCKLCSYVPDNLEDLKNHLRYVHEKPLDPELKDNIIPFKLEKGPEGKHYCVMCNEGFLKIRLLVIHMSVHFNNYSCEICGSVFMTLRFLKKHLEVHENGNFPCDKCDKVFNTTHKRSLHVRGVHLKQYPRRCPICPERFNSNYRRTIHLQDVHNQSTRVHKCEQCSRAFNLKYHLICHIRSVHLQERNQQCDVCHHRFCSKETLKRHMVIHTGEKNYKCETCGMAFLRRKNLKDHLRLHEVV